VESILDECTLVPCPTWPPPQRIGHLASVLKTLDKFGLPRVLRSVRDAAHRDIAGGRGLQYWCFQHGVDKDAGRLVAARLSKQPFIDGNDGLFAAAAGSRLVEARVDGTEVFGAGLAALEEHVAVGVARADVGRGFELSVDLFETDGDSERRSSVLVPVVVVPPDAEGRRAAIVKAVEQSVADGSSLVDRLSDLFPSLLLGPKAYDQISVLTGHEPVFKQLLRHLRALNEGALGWTEGMPFEPPGVTYSVESTQTLEHGHYGPMRDFPAPDGYAPMRWTLHTKLTGGAGARMYFAFKGPRPRPVVLIGYLGPHLDSVRF
jgi:hypothetical protein